MNALYSTARLNRVANSGLNQSPRAPGQCDELLSVKEVARVESRLYPWDKARDHGDVYVDDGGVLTLVTINRVIRLSSHLTPGDPSQQTNIPVTTAFVSARDVQAQCESRADRRPKHFPGHCLGRHRESFDGTSLI